MLKEIQTFMFFRTVHPIISLYVALSLSSSTAVLQHTKAYRPFFFTSSIIIPNDKTSSSSCYSVCHPRAFHSKLKSHLFKHSFSDSPDSLSSHSSHKQHPLNALSASSHPLATGPELPTDYYLEKPSDLTHSLTLWQPDLSLPRTILWKNL